MATIYQKVGENIRKFRRKQDLSQEKLAELSRIDSKSIIQIENGRRNPTLKTLKRIALALKIPLSRLMD